MCLALWSERGAVLVTDKMGQASFGGNSLPVILRRQSGALLQILNAKGIGMRCGSLMLSVVFSLMINAASAESISGVASVIDGDTIEIHDTRIRLHGIDAPESSQVCRRENGEEWRCGQTAANLLADIIGRRIVSCESSAMDRYGRAIAVCRVEDHDINKAMVSQGYAVAYRRYSSDYVDAEKVAKQERRGIWSGAFTMPWDYRRRARLDAGPSTPAAQGSCVIKGNIGRSGNFTYHMPGDRHYDTTRINTSKGERWFCSAAEAEAAGWHKAPQ